jgi:hypothetical protein
VLVQPVSPSPTPTSSDRSHFLVAYHQFSQEFFSIY